MSVPIDFPQHMQRALNRPCYAINFSLRKRRLAQRFLGLQSVLPADNLQRVPKGATALVWGRGDVDTVAMDDVFVMRLEDGFLRSVGLGADLVEPISWVCDSLGIYFDANEPSDLEGILQNSQFSESMLLRAADLRKTIVSAGLSKYNVGSLPWFKPPTNKKVVLVVGQVESDASIQYGAHHIFTNLALLQAVRVAQSNAYIVYKPHPDVLAGMRSGRLLANDDLCDALVEQASMPQLLTQVDEVHVNTSLTGFEALLRGLPVTTHGMPFYAGWGLTQDMAQGHAALGRRTKRLCLDELVAATLISYPVYCSTTTKELVSPELAVMELQAQIRRTDPTPGTRWKRAVLALAARWQGRF